MIVCGTVPTLHPLLVAIQSTIEALKTSVLGSRGNIGGNKDNNGRDTGRDMNSGSMELVTIGRSILRDRTHNTRGTTQSQSSDHLFQGYESLKTDAAFEAYVNTSELEDLR